MCRLDQTCCASWVRYALLVLALATAMGCNGSPWGEQELRDPERQGALYAWDLVREAAPDVPRFAFYPQAGVTYTELSARAFRPEVAFAYARRNERSQLASMFDDTEFAVYVTELGQRLSGEEYLAMRAEENPEYTLRHREKGESGADDEAAHSRESAHLQGRRSSRLPRPNRVVGTLLMFANREDAMALAVVEDPRDPRGHWYFMIEGLRGDRAYYRLGETSRVYLQVATRDLSGAMR